VSDAAARRLHLPVKQVGIVVDGTTISHQQEQKVTEAAQAISADAGFMVERGYQDDDQDRIVLLVLAGLGAALMLGGTLTATFLALSDARPDLATLSAVGASPTTRRGVAAGYALVVGAVGAALGVVVGFVPGLAITFPLTQTDGVDGVTTGPFIDVPWLLILGLVVLLPLLTAAVVGATARSRLPLVARLD
jgi:putative ABC transport system permease protein